MSKDIDPSKTITLPHSPDCRDGNHRKCDGKAWDESTDFPTMCECHCHYGLEAS